MKNTLAGGIILGAAILALSWLLSGCAAGGELSKATDNVNAALISPLLSDNASPVTFFPVQKAGYESLAYPAALAQGQLVLVNGYLRLGTTLAGGSKASSLIIWPPFSSLEIKDNTLQVLNKQGQTIARMGENLKIGGGEVPTEIVYKYIGQTLPEDAVGPYLLAAPGIYNLQTTPIPNNGPNPIMDEAFKEKLKSEPLLLEATIYANHLGISVDEGLKRLKLQLSFMDTGLETKLDDNEAETFGGLWLQHEPEFKFVIAFTRNGEETFKKYLTNELSPFVPYFQVRAVKYSKTELLQAQSSSMAILRKLDIPFDSATNIMQNCVEIRVSESIRGQIEALLQNGSLSLPEGVRINFVGALASPG